MTRWRRRASPTTPEAEAEAPARVGDAVFRRRVAETSDFTRTALEYGARVEGRVWRRRQLAVVVVVDALITQGGLQFRTQDGRTLIVGN